MISSQQSEGIPVSHFDSIQYGLREFLGNSVVTLIGTALVFGTAFAAKVVLARVLTIEDFGLIMTGIMVAGLGITISQLGLGEVLTRQMAYASGKSESGYGVGDLRSGVLLGLLLSVSIAVLFALVARPISVHLFNEPTLAKILPFFGWSLPFYAMADLLAAGERGRGKMWVPQLLVNALRSLLFVGLIVWWLSDHVLSLHLTALAYLLASLIPAVLLLIPFVRTLKRYAIDGWSFVPLLKMSLPLLFISLIGTSVVNQGIPLILKAATSSVQVALFSAAWGFQSFMFLPAWVLSVPLLAIWSRESGAQMEGAIRETFGLAGRWTIAVTAFICLPFLIVPGFMLTLVFGPGYEQAAGAMRIYALGTMLPILVGPVGVLLQVQGRMKELLKAQVVSAGAAIAVAVWLSGEWGVLGAAWSYATLNCINATLGTWLVRNMRHNLYDRTYLKFMFAVGVAFGTGMVLALIPQGQLIRLLVGWVGFGVMFGGLLVFLRPFNQLDETIIRRLYKTCALHKRGSR